MIYWIKAGDTGAVKVGYAKSNVTARIRLLQTGSPWPLIVLRTEPGDRDLETALHRHYRPKHLRAEWFALSDEDVAINLQGVKVALRTTCQRQDVGLTQAGHVIAMLGGISRVAAIVSVPVTTVQSWRDGGFIPARRQNAVLVAAQAAGIDLKPDDFFAVGQAVPADAAA